MLLENGLVQSLPRGTHGETEQGSPAVKEGKRRDPNEISTTGYRSQSLGRRGNYWSKRVESGSKEQMRVRTQSDRTSLESSKFPFRVYLLFSFIKALTISVHSSSSDTLA